MKVLSRVGLADGGWNPQGMIKEHQDPFSCPSPASLPPVLTSGVETLWPETTLNRRPIDASVILPRKLEQERLGACHAGGRLTG